VDINASYQLNEHLTFSAEAINLTDEIQRLHGRARNMVNYVTQTGPRYMLGVRYKF
jgi:outer membrane receptor protein involved in Fe transport